MRPLASGGPPLGVLTRDRPRRLHLLVAAAFGLALLVTPARATSREHPQIVSGHGDPVGILASTRASREDDRSPRAVCLDRGGCPANSNGGSLRSPLELRLALQHTAGDTAHDGRVASPFDGSAQVASWRSLVVGLGIASAVLIFVVGGSCCGTVSSDARWPAGPGSSSGAFRS